MFYHDHAWGITRLNVYAGEAAGYLHHRTRPSRADRPERDLAGLGDGIPLDRPGPDVRPDAAQLAQQDPTWDKRPMGRLGQPVVPPRLHAGPEPRRPGGHERLRALDVRAMVLAAGERTSKYPGRSPTRTSTRA